ncbi:MAG: DNA repair protein RecO [Candidatus Wildermuthbacteria bacterium]|nr:DNA repair protein RecO [Candidatus Wildermuthbacteria bacterium]
MSSYFKTEGVIFKKRDIGENDRVFAVFTKEFGKVHLRAVSERKITSKLRSGLEILYRSDFAFVQGKNKKTITDVSLLDSYQSVREDLPKLKVAIRMLETLDMFLRGEIQDLKVWALLTESLEALKNKEAHKENCSRMYYYFFWNLVSHLGWRPAYDAFEKGTQSILKMFLEQPIPFVLSAGKETFSAPLLRKTTLEYFSRVLKEVQ